MAEKRVLIIDDDPDLVEAVSMLLEGAGMIPLAAYGGIEGLDKARKERPDLIILDVMMPDRDGFKVAKDLAAEETTKNIPLIMLTAVVEHGTTTSYAPHASAKELVADDWFNKPVNPHELVDRVKNLLG